MAKPWGSEATCVGSRTSRNHPEGDHGEAMRKRSDQRGHKDLAQSLF